MKRLQHPPLVMLHGWGVDSNIWKFWIFQYLDPSNMSTPNILGYVHDIPIDYSNYDLEVILERLRANIIKKPMIILGWSFGGVIAQHWAVNYPEEILALILCSTSPRFITSPDWAHGQAKPHLIRMRQKIKQSYPKSIHDFNKLQVRQDKNKAKVFNILQQVTPQYQLPGLLPSLDLMLNIDLRPMVSSISQPTCLISGVHDQITPIGASEWMKKFIPRAELHILQHTSHVPFLSVPNILEGHIINFLKKNNLF
jgi:pimeloyl-[acyl-carrier protein] methyl ester esterase